MTPEQMKALAEQFGQAMAEGGVLYLPALKKMGLAELSALVSLIDQKKRDQAYAAVAAKMTLEELAVEKVALADLMKVRASEHADSVALANEILMGFLKVAIGILATAACL